MDRLYWQNQPQETATIARLGQTLLASPGRGTRQNQRFTTNQGQTLLAEHNGKKDRDIQPQRTHRTQRKDRET
jgi:hypothetical protein